MVIRHHQSVRRDERGRAIRQPQGTESSAHEPSGVRCKIVRLGEILERRILERPHLAVVEASRSDGVQVDAQGHRRRLRLGGQLCLRCGRRLGLLGRTRRRASAAAGAAGEYEGTEGARTWNATETETSSLPHLDTFLDYDRMSIDRLAAAAFVSQITPSSARGNRHDAIASTLVLTEPVDERALARIRIRA